MCRSTGQEQGKGTQERDGQDPDLDPTISSKDGSNVFEIYRFFQEHVGSCCEHIFAVIAAANADDYRLRHQDTDRTRDDCSIDPGHAIVDYDSVKGPFAGHKQCSLAVITTGYRMTSAFQRMKKHIAYHLIIINDKDRFDGTHLATHADRSRPFLSCQLGKGRSPSNYAAIVPCRSGAWEQYSFSCWESIPQHTPGRVCSGY